MVSLQDNMRRRGSNSDDHSLPTTLDNDQVSNSTNGKSQRTVRRRHRRPRLRGKARMDASRQMVLWSLAGAFAIFLGVFLIVCFVPSPVPQAHVVRKDGGEIRHRDLRPPHEFTRFTETAPDCDAMDPKDVRYTLVTQLSHDRMWMMQEHCKRWGPVSPISVAVFTNQSASDVTLEFTKKGCNPETLTVQVLDSDSYPKNDYPVNVLRNLALSVVTTSHVMYSDVDFWESQELHDILHEDDVRLLMARDAKRALVVPAFQLNRQCREWRDCREKNIPKMPLNKQEMIPLIKKRQVFPFDPTNNGGHGSTLYSTWFRQHAGDVIDIPCVKSNRYEPYMVFRYCRDLPPFHEEFSGYGKNKMTMMMHMLRTGYQLSQLGGGFVIHYPHLDSSSRMEWNEKPKQLLPYKDREGQWHQRKPKDVAGVHWEEYKRGQVDKKFVEFRQWLSQQIPDESRVPKCDEFADDDAKLWVSRSQDEE